MPIGLFWFSFLKLEILGVHRATKEIISKKDLLILQ
jgi:hypothetical protein